MPSCARAQTRLTSCIYLIFSNGGLLQLSWWQLILAALLLTHVTIAAVTIYLHRSQAHRALDLHPAVANFFRAWLWLTTGMQTREWVSIHRKHHAKCETPEDPHSPQTRGIKTVLWTGAELYMAEAKNTGDADALRSRHAQRLGRAQRLLALSRGRASA